ncbi:hypothetical protein [Kytococcus sedentarius]|uniref:hypothetical protein n=1 Tax=Kytococcus sedentarius TaxID=1276 RepID=UPI003850BC82
MHTLLTAFDSPEVETLSAGLSLLVGVYGVLAFVVSKIPTPTPSVKQQREHSDEEDQSLERMRAHLALDRNYEARSEYTAATKAATRRYRSGSRRIIDREIPEAFALINASPLIWVGTYFYVHAVWLLLALGWLLLCVWGVIQQHRTYNRATQRIARQAVRARLTSAERDALDLPQDERTLWPAPDEQPFGWALTLTGWSFLAAFHAAGVRGATIHQRCVRVLLIVLYLAMTPVQVIAFWALLRFDGKRTWWHTYRPATSAKGAPGIDLHAVVSRRIIPAKNGRGEVHHWDTLLTSEPGIQDGEEPGRQHLAVPLLRQIVPEVKQAIKDGHILRIDAGTTRLQTAYTKALPMLRPVTTGPGVLLRRFLGITRYESPRSKRLRG